MNTLCLNHKVCSIGKGFIKLIDCMPRVIPPEAKRINCDYAVVQAARVSIGKGLKDYKTDSKLIDFLMRHGHTSPFEMVKFKFHIKAPIFIQRQWIRHRTANVNEVSGRYSVIPGHFYTPDILREQSSGNKQMSGDIINNKDTKGIFHDYITSSVQQYSYYNKLVERGVSRETARIALPLNMYTEFYWSIDLHNLLNFIRLREARNAQPEIRVYAKGIKDLISDLCPISVNSFDNHVIHSVKFSLEECSKLNIVGNGTMSKELIEKVNYVNDN